MYTLILAFVASEELWRSAKAVKAGVSSSSCYLIRYALPILGALELWQHYCKKQTG